MDRQEERNQSNHITNGHFHRLCVYRGFNKKKKGHSFLLQTAQFFPFFKAEGKTWPFYLAQNEKPLKPLWWQLMGKADRFVLSEGDIPQLKGRSPFTSSLGAVSPILEETVMQRRRRKVPCRH